MGVNKTKQNKYTHTIKQNQTQKHGHNKHNNTHKINKQTIYTDSQIYNFKQTKTQN